MLGIMQGLSQPTGVLTNGNAVDVSMANAPIPSTVWIRPAAGDTVTYSHSCDGGTTYTVRGAVAVYTEDILVAGVTHIRFQRTAGTGITSAYGVC